MAFTGQYRSDCPAELLGVGQERFQAIGQGVGHVNTQRRVLQSELVGWATCNLGGARVARSFHVRKRLQRLVNWRIGRLRGVLGAGGREAIGYWF